MFILMQYSHANELSRTKGWKTKKDFFNIILCMSTCSIIMVWKSADYSNPVFNPSLLCRWRRFFFAMKFIAKKKYPTSTPFLCTKVVVNLFVWFDRYTLHVKYATIIPIVINKLKSLKYKHQKNLNNAVQNKWDSLL